MWEHFNTSGEESSSVCMCVWGFFYQLKSKFSVSVLSWSTSLHPSINSSYINQLSLSASCFTVFNTIQMHCVKVKVHTIIYYKCIYYINYVCVCVCVCLLHRTRRIILNEIRFFSQISKAWCSSVRSALHFWPLESAIVWHAWEMAWEKLCCCFSSSRVRQCIM